jgi:RNA polymerase sigma factor (sigma-70 family)
MDRQQRTSTPPDQPKTELEILHERCMNGDHRDEEKLARLIYEFGFKFAIKKFGFDEELAKEFGQELYLAYAVQKKDLVEIRKWLLRVASNMFCAILRQRSRLAQGLKLSEDWYLDSDSPEQLIIDRLFTRVGMRLFSRRESRIVYMRLWRDMRFTDIAKELNLTAGHVRMLYHRAIKKLTEALVP